MLVFDVFRVQGSGPLCRPLILSQAATSRFASVAFDGILPRRRTWSGLRYLKDSTLDPVLPTIKAYGSLRRTRVGPTSARRKRR
jgi:hypothetical protein